MLARTADQASQFTRRDAGRLALASALLVVAMSFILGLDFLPAQTLLEEGRPAPANVEAPRRTVSIEAANEAYRSAMRRR